MAQPPESQPPESQPLDETQLRFDNIRRQFESRWHEGEHPCIEDFLADVREPDYSDVAVALVQAEVRLRKAAGERPEIGDYRLRFPNIHRRLRQIFASPAARASDESATRASLYVYFHDQGFRLEEELGRGGSGRVYRALNNNDGTVVAIKVLTPLVTGAQETMQLFLREMEIHRAMEHPSVVRFVRSGALDDRTAWFAMEYVPGSDLGKLVRSVGGRLDLKTASQIILQVLSALHYAHSFPSPEGPFVHRDVKPNNILIAHEGGQLRAKLADFGLAKNFEKAGMSGLTATGVARGTIPYMTPEQIYDSKYAGPEVDVFSTGAVFYFSLCGQRMYDYPPDATPSTRINHVLQGKIVPLRERRSDIPDAFVQLIQRAVAVDRIRRFRSAQQMEIALRQLLEQTCGA